MMQNFTKAGGGGIDGPIGPPLNPSVQELYRTELSVI